MSMEELDKIVRNPNAERQFRLRCMTELMQREKVLFIRMPEPLARGSRYGIYAAPGITCS